MQAASHELPEQPLPADEGLAEGGRQSTAHRGLPPDIGFLAQHGYSPSDLHCAAVLAGFAGVAPHEFLLKGGYVSEPIFYRALARELELPFVQAPRLSRDARYPDSILSGLAPLAETGCLIIAPAGPVLNRLVTLRKPPSRRLAVTTPSRLTESVFQANRGAIANLAANDLPKRRADLSIRDGISLRQIALLAAIAFVVSLSGSTHPGFTAALIGAGLSPLFLGLVILRLAAALLPSPIEHTDMMRTEDRDLPVYTIIVALYRERCIVRCLVDALSRLDYPPAKLDIKFVLEQDDQETRAALAALELPGFMEVLIAPAGGPRTKPRALNVALPLARGLFTVVYDAEDVPDPGQLRLAVASFRHLPPDVACLQARLSIDNTDDNWLTRLFTIEYTALFDVFNPGLAEIGCPVLLGGTSNHFRTSVLKEVYGWDAWNVTEDADLGIRLGRLGYRVADLPSSTLEEAPSTLGAWMSQRTRWMKGYMQTSICHSRNPRKLFSDLGAWRFIGAICVTFGTVLSALSYPFLTLSFAMRWMAGSKGESGLWEKVLNTGSATLFVAGAVAIVIPACVALGRRRLWRLLPWIAALPVYYTFVSLAAWRGLWELVTAPFHWNKTSHGHARTSRAGLLQKHHAKPATIMSLKTPPP